MRGVWVQSVPCNEQETVFKRHLGPSGSTRDFFADLRQFAVVDVRNFQDCAKSVEVLLGDWEGLRFFGSTDARVLISSYSALYCRRLESFFNLINPLFWISRCFPSLRISDRGMGIPGLLPTLKSITRHEHISRYQGKKVAIDGYSWLHKGAYGCSVELCEHVETDK